MPPIRITGSSQRLPARLSATVAFLLIAALALLLAQPAASAGSSSITGIAYFDLNRDGAHQVGEQTLSNQQLYLLDGTGGYVGTTVTDASGRYRYDSLADGDYLVMYDYVAWQALRANWVPSTTGSIRPHFSLHLSGSAVADFGWRPIVRSTDLTAPVSVYVGANGLRVESFDDVVSARQIYDSVMQLLIGQEASTVIIRFDYGAGGSLTVTSSASANGHYTDYHAVSYLSYFSWLENGEAALAHEYGHAWSRYYAYMVQQDSKMTAYLVARGLAGDPRVNSSYAWSTDEMIAEDYRELFGTAEAQKDSQINQDIPLAKDVPGLKDFLANTFTKPPPAPLTDPPPASLPLSISGVAMSPDPVRTSGTATFSVSAPASVSARILNSKGSLVRTLLLNVSKPAGPVSTSWDRTDSANRRVKRGTYSVKVDAVADDGQSASSGKTFSVY
jgi:hypothetical protein